MLSLYGKEPNETACRVLLEEVWGETVQLVRDYWAVVEALAVATLRERELTGKQVQGVWLSVRPLPDVYE